MIEPIKQMEPDMSQLRFLRRRELIAKVGLSDTTIYMLEKAGKFPKRIAITPRCVVWDEDEISSWMSERIARPASLAPTPDQSTRKTRPGRGKTVEAVEPA
jgi:prophage regulatory protein